MILLNKPVGVTPAQLVKQYKLLFPHYSTIPLGVAGRLDPMAEGLLVIMEGEENKKQSQFMGLDKTYQVDVLFGIISDSYDVLGLVAPGKSLTLNAVQASLSDVIANFKGEITQEYPPFSAVRVNGKPLFWWAHNNQLSRVEIPKAKRIIYEIRILSIWQELLAEIYSTSVSNISITKGDFRQSESIISWQHLTQLIPLSTPLVKARLEITSSSGTYMRTLAQDIGDRLGCGAIASRIVRTQVGPWSIEDAMDLKKG